MLMISLASDDTPLWSSTNKCRISMLGGGPKTCYIPTHQLTTVSDPRLTISAPSYLLTTEGFIPGVQDRLLRVRFNWVRVETHIPLMGRYHLCRATSGYWTVIPISRSNQLDTRKQNRGYCSDRVSKGLFFGCKDIIYK